MITPNSGATALTEALEICGDECTGVHRAITSDLEPEASDGTVVKERPVRDLCAALHGQRVELVKAVDREHRIAAHDDVHVLILQESVIDQSVLRELHLSRD